MTATKTAVLASFAGSTGDVAYLSGIGQVLQAAGHRVQLLVPKVILNETRNLLQSMGLNDAGAIDPNGMTMDEMLSKVDTLKTGTLSERWSAAKLLLGHRRKWMEDAGRTILNICNSSETQFIVGDASSKLLLAAAHARDIPYIQASPMPYVPTRHFYLGSRYPCVDTWGTFNLLRWEWGGSPRSILRTLRHRLREPNPSRMVGDRELARELAELYPRGYRKLFGRYYKEQVNHTISASPVIIPKASDWGDNVHVLGYTPWNTEALAPPPELEDFLADGEPPLYMGFGSYGYKRFWGPRGLKFLRQLAEAAATHGERLVFYTTGTSIKPEHDLPKNVFLAGNVSHDWLFPRCKAVVCHGGYGTIHASLIARKPLIIYPFQTDQFFLATRMEQLGAAPAYRNTFRRFRTPDFIRDLVQIREDSRFQTHAANLGAQIEQENGAQAHLARIHEILGLH